MPLATTAGDGIERRTKTAVMDYTEELKQQYIALLQKDNYADSSIERAIADDFPAIATLARLIGPFTLSSMTSFVFRRSIKCTYRTPLLSTVAFEGAKPILDHLWRSLFGDKLGSIAQADMAGFIFTTREDMLSYVTLPTREERGIQIALDKPPASFWPEQYAMFKEAIATIKNEQALAMDKIKERFTRVEYDFSFDGSKYRARFGSWLVLRNVTIEVIPDQMTRGIKQTMVTFPRIEIRLDLLALLATGDAQRMTEAMAVTAPWFNAMPKPAIVVDQMIDASPINPFAMNGSALVPVLNVSVQERPAYDSYLMIDVFKPVTATPEHRRVRFTAYRNAFFHQQQQRRKADPKAGGIHDVFVCSYYQNPFNIMPEHQFTCQFTFKNEGDYRFFNAIIESFRRNDAFRSFVFHTGASELVGLEPPKCDCGSYKAMNYDFIAWNHQGNAQRPQWMEKYVCVGCLAEAYRYHFHFDKLAQQLFEIHHKLDDKGGSELLQIAEKHAKVAARVKDPWLTAHATLLLALLARDKHDQDVQAIRAFYDSIDPTFTPRLRAAILLDKQRLYSALK